MACQLNLSRLRRVRREEKEEEKQCSHNNMQLTSVDTKEHDRFRALLEARENHTKAEVEARIKETGKTYLQHCVQYHAKILVFILKTLKIQ